MNPYLLPSIEKGPAVLERILMRIPQEEWDIAVAPDRFTTREVIAHLAEWEPIMRARIEQAVGSPDSTITLYDEEQMAIDGNYASLDPIAQSANFKIERSRTAELIRSLTPDQLKNAVTHPERGIMTAEDFANFLLGHDLYHIDQLVEAMG